MLIYGFLPIALYILKIIVVRKSQYKIFSFHINCKMGWERLQLKSESSMCAIYIFCIACFSLQFLGAVYQYWLYHIIRYFSLLASLAMLSVYYSASLQNIYFLTFWRALNLQKIQIIPLLFFWSSLPLFFIGLRQNEPRVLK